MARKDALRLPFETFVPSAGLAYVKSQNVESGWCWCIEGVAWRTDKAMSGGNTRVRLQIAGGGPDINLEEQDAPAPNVVYTYTDKQYLYYPEHLQLELDQAQASTTVKGSIIGYAEEIK